MTRASSVLAFALLLAGSSAFAQKPSAGELFKEGRALAKAGKNAEACTKFKASQELDPQLGTLFNIAQCEEKTGKLASALAAYREVVAKDQNAERKAKAAEFQSALEPRVPKIVVQIGKPPPGLVVTLDGPTGGRPIDANLPVDVDLGDYNVIARADGYRELASKVSVDKEGETKTVSLALALVHGTTDVVSDQPHTQPPPPHDEAPAHHSHRKTYGYAGIIGGGAVVATGVVFGVIANGKWSDAQAVCGGTTCTTQADVDKAQGLVNDSRSAGNLSTGLIIGGAALAAVGAYLVITTHDERDLRVSASASSSAAGFSLTGRF